MVLESSSTNDKPSGLSPVERARGLQALVTEHANANEQQRFLVAEVAAAMAQQGLYRIAAPRDSFGTDHSAMTQVETIEAIAYADGSTAWNLMIGIESFGLIAPGFVNCRELIENPDVVLCSSTAAAGKGEQVDGGYRISGRWQFVSGCHNAQLFAATVVLSDAEGQPISGRRYAVLPRKDWQILDTWHTNGLCGSGSHDVVVDNVVVPHEYIVSPLGDIQHSSANLRFPIGSRLAYNKLGVAWGMARAAIDAFVALGTDKKPRFSSRNLRERPRSQRALAEAEVRLRAGRALVMELLEEMWAMVEQGDKLTAKQQALFQLACSDSVLQCIAAVETVATAAGTSANMKGEPIERILRDIRVVGQHASVAAHHIEDAGRVLFGLPANEMMLAGVTSDG